MTMLERTDLTVPEKIHLAASAAAGQGVYGAVSDLADAFDVSRTTVYDVQKRAVAALSAQVSEGPDDAAVWVRVDRRQCERAVVALRTMAPTSLRAIEALVPVVYPGVSLSYGSVQGITSEAERRAAAVNAAEDLSGIDAGALDEMFSQGQPVLGGVDLDSGALFALALRDGRSAEDWTEVLSTAKDQGLSLQVAVKDAARGIASGVSAVFPRAEQRDDCFHALREMSKVHRVLERRAYAMMEREETADRALAELRRTVHPSVNRQGLVSKQGWARRRCREAMERHDRFEAAQRRAIEALEVVDLESATVRDPAQMKAEIEAAAAAMIAMDNGRCRRVGQYIHNRAPGLVLYAAQVKQQLDDLASRHGHDAVRLACVVWRLADDLRARRRRFRRVADQRRLASAFALLHRRQGAQVAAVLDDVNEVLTHRHRASSAIEGFNAALRPFLYVHKGVTQNFLELFRVYYNRRIRKWGPHKGTSPRQVLTGTSDDDWLSDLGYPPSDVWN